MKNYTRKTNRASTPKEVVMIAVKGVVEDGNSYNAMSNTYKIPKRSLVRYCKQYRNIKATDRSISVNDISVGYEKCSRIFADSEEDNLVQYIAHCNSINSGLSQKQARELIYQYAVATKIQIPPSWKMNMIAPEDWFYNFMKRNKTLNIGVSEISPTRATSNHSVEFFFDNLTDIMKRFELQPYNIWNMNEIGVFTKGANRVVGRHNLEQIEYLTSTKEKQFVTLVSTVSAYGNSIPPFFVFPTVCFEDNFIQNGPIGCAGGANLSGWMDEDDFSLYLAHFVKYVRPSKNNRVLLLLDNHNSYFSISALDFATKNGIIILSIPLQYSYLIQPLNVGVFSSLKLLTSTAMDSWILNHPGKTVSIYDIPGIVRNILPKALTPLNIMAGFENTGIYPLKHKAFTGTDLASLSIEDETISPQQENNIAVADGQNTTEQSAVNIMTFNNQDNDGRVEDIYCTSDTPVMSNATIDNNNLITDDWKLEWNVIEITPDIQQTLQNISHIIQEPQPSTSCEPMPVVEAISLDKEPLSKIRIKNVRSLAKREIQSISIRTKRGKTSTSLTDGPIRDRIKKKSKKSTCVKRRKKVENRSKIECQK